MNLERQKDTLLRSVQVSSVNVWLSALEYEPTFGSVSSQSLQEVRIFETTTVGAIKQYGQTFPSF